jgi:hypothetical protein
MIQYFPTRNPISENARIPNMPVAIATCSQHPGGVPGDRLLVEALARIGVAADAVPWTENVDWGSFELVVIRSTWDYTAAQDRFLAWVRGLPAPVANAADLVAWNSDKRYLHDLAQWGIPTVPTQFIDPGQQAPELVGEIVVKPSVSAGARNTGRFGPGAHAEAVQFIERIHQEGKTAMVQPFVASPAETAVVLIDGVPSHTLRKGLVLRPDEVAPASTPGQPADVMQNPDLVTAGSASPAQLTAAASIAGQLRDQFGDTPLYLRVDLLEPEPGRPVLLELEAVEPNLYFELAPGSADRMAAAIARAIR